VEEISKTVFSIHTVPMAQRQTRTVRQPVTKFAHLRKKMDQRKLRASPGKKK
jgi:hypothetical protein